MTADAATMGMDPQARLSGAFARSLAFHVVVLGGLSAFAWLNRGAAFGDPNAGGTAVGIEAVATIPLPPRRGPENPVANDTENETPPAPVEKPTPKTAPEPPPKDAVSLKMPEPKSKELLTPKQRLKSFSEIASNQLTSKGPQAVSSPMYAQGSAGKIGSNFDTTLGTRFPAYAARIQEVTRQGWRTQDVDGSVSSAPPVTIGFELMRDGHVERVRLIRRSGIASLDESVLSAVENAHYPALPEGYEKSSVPVEFTFELKR